MQRPDSLIHNLPLWILRFVLLLIAGAIGIYAMYTVPAVSGKGLLQLAAFAVVMIIAVLTIGLDILVHPKKLDTISAVYFGLIVGLFLTYVAGLALAPFLDLIDPPNASLPSGGAGGMPNPLRHPMSTPLRNVIQLVLGMVLCYVCISFLLQTKNDFRFIIPYVEFAKEVKGTRPVVVDTSVVIDGRIADVVETKILDDPLIMPRFVLAELHAIADSADRLRRSRGRRGLDILNRLRNNPEVELQIYDRELPEWSDQPVDMKLVLMAKHLNARIITNDFNLNKVARLHGVEVINLNDLANALKPAYLPGEELEVYLVRPGEEDGQGVGYLEDGTMVVVEDGREHLHRQVRAVVTSTLQTSAGRMIFGKFKEELGTPSAGVPQEEMGKQRSAHRSAKRR